MKGLMMVNAFLRQRKFGELYDALQQAAAQNGLTLDMRGNDELALLCAAPKTLSDYDFALLWDKDYYVARALEQKGLRLFNRADAMLRCDDKALTYLSLLPVGLPMPQTILCPKTFAAVGYPQTAFLRDVGERLGFPLVLKECFGSFGQQVYLIESPEALEQKVLEKGATPMLFQALITESYGRDVRINVVGGRVAAAMLRTGREGDFRSNISAGGSMAAYTPTQEEVALAIAAADALGLDFAGVDVLFGKDGPVLCEVNSNAHFLSTLQATGVNMATEIVRYIAEQLR